MKPIIIACLLLLLTACGPPWKEGEYEVYVIDNDVNLGIKIGDSGFYHRRVDHQVVAVGANQEYIVAKRLKPGNPRASYFYIQREIDNEYMNLDEITKGPFTDTQFTELTKELGLPSFSKEF